MKRSPFTGDLFSRKNAAFQAAMDIILQLFFCFFALLICNAATGLASRLARCLAFAATAVFSAFAKIFSIQSLNTLHIVTLQ